MRLLATVAFLAGLLSAIAQGTSSELERARAFAARHAQLVKERRPDRPSCRRVGIPAHRHPVCCAAACGTCGGVGCAQRPGGGRNCCIGYIIAANKSCNKHEPPCVIVKGQKATPQTGEETPQTGDEAAVNFVRVDKMGHTKGRCTLAFSRIKIDADNLVGSDHTGTLNNI